MRKVKQSER